MPKEFSRQVRVADQIQRSLAQLIQSEISDPRLGLVNINQVDVSRDYSNARVFVTFVGDESDEGIKQSIAILNKASGFLRSLLAKNLNSRSTPRLNFVYDKTSVEGQRLSHLIDQAVRPRSDD
ncbi:30S ribosome-binding factor RbfA [Gilvimarinus sp. F26214L]|uniref:30S ribosome-binding factor RbfA n=1 Tax=Gilvimarinus sp. DZF01 TaxID=3461371 RepID=UPI004045E48D